MKIDTGFAVVILAALVFYLRLIVIQRQRVRQVKQAAAAQTKKKNPQKSPAAATPRYSVLSQRKSDWVIAGVGALAVIAGILLYLEAIPWALGQEYWWAPTAGGIILFSWAFRL